MRVILFAAALALAACNPAPAPQAALPGMGGGGVAPEFVLQDANATGTAAARDVQSTTWAVTQVYEQRTAEAFVITQTSAAVGYTQTAYAATPTAAALAITMTTDAGNATNAAVSTTTYSGAAYIATSTQIASQSDYESTMRELGVFSRRVWIAFGITFTVCTAILSALIFFSVRRYARARILRERYEVLTGGTVFDRLSREIISLGAAQADSDDPEVIEWRKQWYQAMSDAAYIAALSGSWTIAAMCRQYPADARPISEDDWQAVTGQLISAGVLVEGRGQRGIGYADGHNIITLRAALEAEQIPLPAYDGKPAPVCDISLAQRNATQKRNAKRRPAEAVAG